MKLELSINNNCLFVIITITINIVRPKINSYTYIFFQNVIK